MSESEENPFSCLIQGQSKNAANQKEPEDRTLAEEEEAQKISDLLFKLTEEVFNISFINDVSPIVPHVVFVDVVGESVKEPLRVTYSLVKSGLFERIMMTNPQNYLISNGKIKQPISLHTTQSEAILYLFECFKRLRQISATSHDEFKNKVVLNLLTFVIENICTCLRQPSLFDEQDFHMQIIKLYEVEWEYSDLITDLMKEIADLILVEESKGELAYAIAPIFMQIQSDFERANVLTFPRSHFVVLNSFASIAPLAEAMIDFQTPAVMNLRPGGRYVDTVIGSILNLSCLPKTVDGMIEYFEKPLDGALSALEGNLWTAMNELCEKVHCLIEKILRVSTDLRHKVLKWLGNCLDTNIPRGRLWATTTLGLPGAVGYISDGFALNLASVMLRLSEPFVSDQRKLLKIDPTYPAFKIKKDDKLMAKHGIHSTSFFKETCLQPRQEGVTRPVSTRPYSFMTECFFLTQRALDLSVRVLLERTQQLYQEIGRLQQTYTDAQAQVQPRMDIIESFRERMEMEMSRYLCLRCALLEPVMLKLLGKFEVATAIWLIQVILDPIAEDEVREHYAPMTSRPLTFPLEEKCPPTLRCVPELIVENISRFMKLAKNYSPQTLEEGGIELMEPLLSLLLVLMGSKNRARNPHLRANLAQCLECLLPKDRDKPSLNPNPLGVFYREKIFLEHPHKNQIVGCLLNVFVSIEMTGESVAFEQKFNYRRPMYTVMDYLWGIEEHRAIFKAIAEEAEWKMEEVSPPIFLRFLNLLVNDAIFLLDEALSNMAQLRTLQTARDSGEWNNLPTDEHDRNEQYFRQIGMTARFDNILGKETIHTLRYMSTEIRSILCHKMMVDRIASMLNYFLYNLVGPKKKNLKVKDHSEYKFDPGAIVRDICRIYVNLGSSDEFCSAVSRDGRSYSPQLFTLAEDVLARIGGASIITGLQIVSEKVASLAVLQQTEEELLSEAPEEFLDPIMSTLMTDPVTLPSSRINIDRSTIARHLLSDQTDPFNRSPLTMNLVQPNIDLKDRIDKWIAEKREGR